MKIPYHWLCVGTLIFCVAGEAQQVAGSPRTKPRQTVKKEPLAEARYGDSTLSGYERMKFVPRQYAVAEGPGTTIKVIQLGDEKNPRTETTIQAPKMTAFLDKKDPKLVERAEAEGGFTFDSARVNKPSGTTAYHCKGTTLKWFKKDEYVELSGPLNYKVETHDGQGKLIESATGTAQSARYDTANQEFILNSASIKYFGSKEEAADIKSAAHIFVDKDMVIRVESAPGGSAKFVPRKPEDRKP